MKNETTRSTNKMRRMIYRLSNYSVGTKLIRMRSLLMLCGVTILSGCGASVVPAGPDTYMISTTEIGLTQGGRAKAEAYRKADEWCRARGLVMVPIAVDQHSAEPFGRYGGAELTFRALQPGDPEIKRINVEKPDFTQRIQVR
jgi:hypothetical protein